MDLTTITAWLYTNAENPLLWAVTCLAVYGVLPHVVALTPTLADDKALGIATRLLNLLVGNYGAARNGAALAGRVLGTGAPAGDPPAPARRGPPPPPPISLGSIALALAVALPVLLTTACSSVPLTPAEQVQIAEASYEVSAAAVDAYCARPDADAQTKLALPIAKDAARKALDAAGRSVVASDPAAWPVLLAAGQSAAAGLAAELVKASAER